MTKTTATTVKATELSPLLGVHTLADGAHVYAVSVQRNWVYARALTPDGRIVRRRYRHNQMVEVKG